MSALYTVAGKLITLFIYVIVGYIVCRRRIVSTEFCQGISRFLMAVTLPCLVLTTFETEYTTERLIQAGQVYGISLIIFGVSIIIGYLSARIFRIAPEAKAVWIYSVTFPNHAFMGWPVMGAVFGQEAIFFAAFANLAFCTYAYTYGIWLMEKTGTASEGKGHHSLKEQILTPINVAIVIGLVLFINQWRLPGPIDNAVAGFSNLTTPLAMFYVGTILTQNSVREVLSDKRAYACALMRLIIIPLLVFFIARPFVHDPMVYGVLVIGHAMPVAGFCAIFAGEYGNDVVLASKFIFITTLLCIVTIPVFAMFL